MFSCFSLVQRIDFEELYEQSQPLSYVDEPCSSSRPTFEELQIQIEYNLREYKLRFIPSFIRRRLIGSNPLPADPTCTKHARKVRVNTIGNGLAEWKKKSWRRLDVPSIG